MHQRLDEMRGLLAEAEQARSLCEARRYPEAEAIMQRVRAQLAGMQTSWPGMTSEESFEVRDILVRLWKVLEETDGLIARDPGGVYMSYAFRMPSRGTRPRQWPARP